MSTKFQEAKSLLSGCGLSDKILDRLDSAQIYELANFFKDHASSSYVLHHIRQLAAMELLNKRGSTLLVNKNIATPEQLRNISPSQLNEVVETYLIEQDEEGAMHAVRKAIIENQQAQIALYSIDNAYKLRNNHS